MDKKDKNQKRVVPFKNYIILVFIAFLTVVITLYINEWITLYNQNKIATSPLTNRVNELNFSEIPMTLSETNEAIFYFSYVNDQDIYNKEKKILRMLEKNEKIDYMIYVNISEFMNNNEYIAKIKNLFPELSNEINSAPLLVYVKNGKAVTVMNSNGRNIDDSDLKQIIETYEID